MVSNQSETPSNIAVTLTGTYDANDIDAVKLYFNSTPALDGNEAQLSSLSSFAATSPHTFNFSNANAFSAGTTYFIIATDVHSTGDVGHTVIASKLTFTGLTGAVTDTQTATSGTKTIS